MQAIEVIRRDELKAGDSTPGITRERAFEHGSVIVSRSRVAGGVVSSWHHHGTRRLYGFLASGSLRLEYGLGGREAVELKPGDFFQIPRRLVHPDVNPDGAQEAVIVNILVGKGTAAVNVAGPQR